MRLHEYIRLLNIILLYHIATNILRFLLLVVLLFFYTNLFSKKTVYVTAPPVGADHIVKES